MSDNVNITSGAGTGIATDNVGGQHYQKMKVAIGTADSAVMIGHAEDAAHSSGDGGIAVLTRRIDAAASSAGTSGDYATLDTDATGRLWTREAGMGGWTANHAPAAATQATIARAAAGAGLKNVCTSIAVSLASAAAPTVGVVTFVLRDGATGVGTIVWQTRLSLPAVAGEARAVTLPVWIEGTANTAMTLETTAAPPANVQATISFTGTIL